MKVATLDSKHLKAEALRLGFSHVGLAPAEPVDEGYMAGFERWLREGRHGEMHYMENYLDIRRDPRLLLSGAKTIVSLAMSYNPGDQPTQRGIAWYAQGRDYHEVIREKLREFVSHLLISHLLTFSPSHPLTSHPLTFSPSHPLTFSPSHFRICVDTAPIPERYWAWRCGLGWIGRHGQLVIPHEGSAFFLCELLLTAEADHYDEPMAPTPEAGALCGKCRRCLDACPTGALSAEGMDTRRCISYLTIEHRGDLPEAVKPHLSECFYGCDRCLRACPHLSKAGDALIEEFRPSERLLAMTDEDWEHLTVEDYRELFRDSAVRRAKYEGLLRNINSTVK